MGPLRGQGVISSKGCWKKREEGERILSSYTPETGLNLELSSVGSIPFFQALLETSHTSRRLPCRLTAGMKVGKKLFISFF